MSNTPSINYMPIMFWSFAGKAANNEIVVCRKYHSDTLVKELGINNVNRNNRTYIPIDDSFKTIVKSHNQFITTVGSEMSGENQNLPYRYSESQVA